MSFFSFLFGSRIKKSNEQDIPVHNMLIGKHSNDFHIYPGSYAGPMAYGHDFHIYSNN